jgi:hypothetical protein
MRAVDNRPKRSRKQAVMTASLGNLRALDHSAGSGVIRRIRAAAVHKGCVAMTQWKTMFGAVCAAALLGVAGSASAQAPTSVAPGSGGAPAVSAPTTSGGGAVSRGGGGYRGSYRGGGGYRHHGGYHHRYRGGYSAGFATGLILGGAATGPYYYDYYNEPDYYAGEPAYQGGYDDGDAVAYCRSRFRSYDPASGTYLGYDGLRHPCP